MRMTLHGGRYHKNGKAYSDKHNDRNFDTRKADNINPETTDLNKNVNTHKGKSNHDAEMEFYEKHFRAKLDQQNASYEKNRHKERCMTMEQYKNKHPPYELIFQIGNKDEHVDAATLQKACSEIVNHIAEQYKGNIAILNMSLHLDETTPHCHIRLAWIGHDKDGLECPIQNYALRELNIEPPHKDKPISKDNCLIKTFSQHLRDEAIAICQGLGLDINKVPSERSREQKTLLEYKCEALERECNTLREKQHTLERNTKAMSDEIELAKKILDVAKNSPDIARLMLQDDRFTSFDSQTLAEHRIQNDRTQEIERVWDFSQEL